MNIKEADKASSINSVTLIAVACAQDNAFNWGKKPNDEKLLWLKYADAVAYVMSQSDEARFTLYDYLDATINNNGVQWQWTAREIKSLMKKKRYDEIEQKIVKLAENARKAYEV